MVTKSEIAIAAMQGLLANPNVVDNKKEETIEWVCDAAILFAEKMFEKLKLNPKQ